MSDTITIAHARHRRLAKLVTFTGEIVGYDSARTFDLAEIEIRDLHHLAGVLERLLRRPDCAVLRGKPIAGPRVDGVRRLLYPDAETGDQPTLRDVPRRWLAVDIEGLDRPESVSAADIAGCAEEAIDHLPAAFRDAQCVAQPTGSHGLKPGIRARLWFWLDRPTTGDELKQWLAGAPADPAVFSAAQCIYTAAPVFEGIRVDHLPTRLVELAGEECVAVPPPEALAPPPAPEPRPLPPLADPQSHATARATAMIARALYRVASAPEGQKHHQLRAAATTIGGVMDAANINEAEAHAHLVHAVMQAGAIDRRNAERTAEWGIRKGRERPLALGGSQ